MLKVLVFLLLKEVLSLNSGFTCERNQQLADKALADIYVVDRSSDIARAFYRYASCWLGSKRVKDVWDDEQYPAAATVEIVIGDVELGKAIRTTGSTTRVIVLHQCQAGNTACLNQPEIIVYRGGLRVIHAHPSDFRHIAQLVITGESAKSETLEQTREFSSELARLYHSQALRMGGIVALVIMFILISCAVCCHSIYTVAILLDDIGWRRDQLVNRNDGDFLEAVEAEDGMAIPPPMRSPAPGMETALSRSRTSLCGTDVTQSSQSAKSSSLISVG